MIIHKPCCQVCGRGLYWLAVMFLVFSSSMVQADSHLANDIYQSKQVKHVVDYFNKYNRNGEVKVFVLGKDVNILPREKLGGIISYKTLVTSKFDMDNNEWPMSRYNGHTNYIVVNSDYNVVFIQSNILQNDNNELFDKLFDLEYLSLIVSNENIEVDLSKNIKLREVFLKSGKLEKLTLPKKSSIELIGTVMGSIDEIVNLDSQDNLVSLRVDSSLKNINDLNGNLSLERLIVFPGNGAPKKLKVSTMKNIKYLTLYDDDENDIKNINILNELETLSLLNMSAENVKLPSTLKMLEFTGRENKKMPDFPNDFELVELRISNTSISEINNLDNLKKLKKLYLFSMPLNEIKGVGNLSDLERLYIEYTNINEIDGLSVLNNLSYLKLRDNKISDLSGLSGFKSCTYIDVSYNLIEKINDDMVDSFFGCPIALFGNPVYENADYDFEIQLINLAEHGSFNK